MSQNTKIEWCDFTLNPWSGCTKVSPGCAHCYAETNYSVKMRGVKWGPSGNRIVKAESGWKEPLKWDREAKAAGERRRVFCASLADIFEDWQGPMLDAHGRQLFVDGDAWFTPGKDSFAMSDPVTMQDVRARLFALIDATPNLDWLLLTKRPENIGRMMPARVVNDRRPIFPGCPGPLGEPVECVVEGGTRHNVWLGVSVEDQARADERIPLLLKVPAAVRFLSVEPLLGPVDLTRWLNIRWQCSGCRGYFSGSYQKVCPECGKSEYWSGSHAFNGKHRPPNDTFPVQTGSGLDWLIVGGESGPGARPCNVEWIRSIVQQCKAAGVPTFVKQLGGNPGEWLGPGVAPGSVTLDTYDMPGGEPDDEWLRLLLLDKKGGNPAEWPEDLRVRDFPRMS